MANYRCPFCGEDVTRDDILFCYEKTPEFYEDRVRYEFLTSCYSQYHLENGAMFRGLYFPPKEEWVKGRDENGYPTKLSVKLGDGLAPRELKGTEDAFDSEPVKKPTDETRIDILTRACPHCHCSLPPDFGLIPTVTVSLLGGRASGKTAFLIAMIQQLNAQLGMNNLGSVTLLPESQAYMDPQIQFFQENHGITMPTPNQRLFPLVFRYVNATGAKSTSCFVVIYDIAGEVIVNKDINAMANHKGVREATIFLLVIDPNQFNNGGYYVAARKGMQEQAPPTGEQHDYYHENILSFIQQKMNACADITGQIRHVITVLTKMDYPLTTDWELFGDHSKCIVKTGIGNLHEKAVHLDVLNRIDHELDTLYRKKLNNLDIKEQIRNVFNDKHQALFPDEPPVGVNLLGVSTFTQRLEGGKVVFVNDCSAGAAKHRIIEPFLEILVLAGIVPTKGGAGSQPQPAQPQQQNAKRRWPRK